MILMNLSLCQLSSNTLVGFLGSAYAFQGRPRNFTKIEYTLVFVIAHLKAMIHSL